MRWRLVQEKSKYFLTKPAQAAAPDLIDQWLASIGGVGTTTRQTYGAAVLTRALPLIARMGYDHRIDGVGAERVMDALRGRFSISTVNVTASALASLWSEMARRKLVTENPWEHVARENPQTVVPQRLISPEEALRMIDRCARFRDRVLLRVFYVTGARVSEIVRPRTARPRDPRGLRWRDVRREVDGTMLTLYGKGGRPRIVGIPPGLGTDLWALSRTHGADEPVFPMTRQRAQQIVRAAARRAGIDAHVSPHWFRHVSAVQGLAEGEPPNVLQARLGHANLRTTSIYTEIMAASQGRTYVPDIGDR